MNASSGLEYPGVGVQETGGGEPAAGMLHLRVREGDPYFTHLPGGEESLQVLYAGTQEGGVIYPFGLHLSRARVDACPFDVYADEVLIRETAGQPYGVFPFTASQFEYYRAVVMEELSAPASLHRESLFAEQSERILEHAVDALHFPEFLEFILSHFRKNSRSAVFSCKFNTFFRDISLPLSVEVKFNNVRQGFLAESGRTF